MTKSLLKKLLKPVLGRKKLQSFFHLLFLFSLKGMNIGGGSTYSESGEEWVIKFLAKDKKDFMLFDVGANQGKYALMAEKILQDAGTDANIYSFEPAKATFGILEKNISGHGKIFAYNLGLGESDGVLTIHYDAEGSGLASLYDREISGQGKPLARSEEVKISTVDNFCAENHIERIGLLKLDVEGHELKALFGSKKMIEEGRVDAIQFEFGGTALDARVYLKDFFSLLSPRYKIFRILQNGLQELEKYSEYDEIFITTNFLALKK